MNPIIAEEIKIPTVGTIKLLLEPIHSRLESIEFDLKKQFQKNKPKKYYRNIDLKNLFGLSSNTIIKYRETGILPYTRLGDIYLYEVTTIETILTLNNVSI